MGWLNARPEQIVDRADVEDVLTELRAASGEPWSTATLDFVLRQWTLRALARAGDLEGLVTLDDLVGVALARLAQIDEADRYRARWHAFRDLLESKRQAIRGRQSGRAKQLLHAGPILEALASGAKRQSELQTALGLSAQRLSQVLSVMEEAGLIERERHGKQKIVTLASSSEMHVPIPACRRVGPMIFGIRPSRVARSATRSW